MEYICKCLLQLCSRQWLNALKIPCGRWRFGLPL